MNKKWNGLYYPTKDFQKQANLNDKKIYKEAQKDPASFWSELAKKELFWQKPFTETFLRKGIETKWFDGGRINLCENALDKNIEKNPNKIALIWEPENPDEQTKKYTYEELLSEVNKFSNALKKLGVKKGDTVGIYLPIVPEIAISMLACTRIGAVHLVVFSAFSPEALKIRLQTIKTKYLITADGYYRRGKILNLKQNADFGIENTSVEKVIIVKRAGNDIIWNNKRNFWFDELVNNESNICPPEQIDSEDLLFVLPESGTTGQFLPIMHTTGGYSLQAKVTGKWVFDFKENDILWSTADPGWITGHTYSIYSPLLNGITTLLFEGALDFPTTDRWAKIIEKNKVTILYTAPTAIRMFKQYGADSFKNCDISSLRILGSVGEIIDEPTWMWYFKEIGKNKCPIVDTYWQTETGAIVITSLPGIGPFKPACAGLALPGINIDIFDENGKPCKNGIEGNLVLLPPYCPAILRGIFESLEKYTNVYWNLYGKDIYITSDRAIKDKDGIIKITGRADDVIKIAGRRITTSELESAINKHPEISESAVIGITDEIKGSTPLVFAVYRGQDNKEKIIKEIELEIRKSVGPIATPKKIYLVNELPKTRSGKIMRILLKKLYFKENLGDISTLSNPETIENIKKQIAI
jgi:acetyl-CoA synthetase